MISLTRSARAHILRVLAETEKGVVLRIFQGPNGLEMEIGRVQNGDSTYDCENQAVLAIDQMTARTLIGKTVDTVIVDGAMRLELVD